MDLSAIAAFVNANILPHWPIVAAMMIFMVIGQVVKTSVFTKDAYRTNKPVWLFWWGRKTLAIQPIFAGMILGTLWRNPEAGVTTLAGSMGYFAMAGCFSVWAYEMIKGIAKKEGFDIDIPGVDDTVPPPAPPAPPAK
jgi:hypothetical protein